MLSQPVTTESWQKRKIRTDQVRCYMHGDRDFIDDAAITATLAPSVHDNPWMGDYSGTP